MTAFPSTCRGKSENLTRQRVMVRAPGTLHSDYTYAIFDPDQPVQVVQGGTDALHFPGKPTVVPGLDGGPELSLDIRTEPQGPITALKKPLLYGIVYGQQTQKNLDVLGEGDVFSLNGAYEVFEFGFEPPPRLQVAEGVSQARRRFAKDWEGAKDYARNLKA